MTINDLIKIARQDILNDVVPDYLWSDAQLTRFTNDAIVEACHRAPILRKAKIVQVTSGTAGYDIDPTILQIYLAKLDDDDNPLTAATDYELSLAYGSGWRKLTGSPKRYMRRGHNIRLFPIPVANDSLALTTSNIPDENFDIESDIEEQFHPHLVFYIGYKAFMMPDMDTYNPVKANDYLSMFDAKFGKRKSAKFDSVSFEMPMYGTIISSRMA